jgi:cytochrome c2
MKTWSRWMVAVLFLLAIAFPAAAQWMGGPMGYPGGGGCNCRMMGTTTPPVDPASLPEPSSPGAKILQSKCVQCHGLVSPRQEASQDWPYILDRMDRRMEMMARGGMGMMMRSSIQPLTPEEKTTLLAYLQANAFQALAPSAIPDSREPGSLAFNQLCSRCHALPDPSEFTAEEWKNVVGRMAGKMEAAGYGSLAPEEKKAILNYLEKNARQ